MSEIFVSYSRDDREAIKPILAAMQEMRLEYWLDQSNILPTTEFNDEILKGLGRCQWFLLAMTPRSALSEYVKDELHWALSNRSGRIIPIMLEKCDPTSFHLRLLRIQYVDLTGRNDDGADLLDKTLRSVQAAGAEQSLDLKHHSLAGDLEIVSLLLTFISRHHQKHLRNLTASTDSERQMYHGGRSVRHELRDLCAWGLLERQSGQAIGQCAGDGQRFLLSEAVNLTPLGKRLAQYVR